MNNTSSVKSNKIGTPKTPGGISKSLLTPCRRLGLSRNWRKSGPSPFISPLSTSGEVKQETAEIRKRKECVLNEEAPASLTADGDKSTKSINIDRTPSRNVDLPRRKKSKTLLYALNKSEKCTTRSNDYIETQPPSKDSKEVSVEGTVDTETENVSVREIISSPVYLKSSKIKVSPLKPSLKENDVKEKNTNDIGIKQTHSDTPKPKITKLEDIIENRENSPNNLTKECMVVIQKKIFKEEINDTKEKCNENTPANIKQKNSASQALFDSDSDDVPLSTLNKKVTSDVMNPLNSIDNDDDFVKSNKKVKKLQSNIPLILKNSSKSNCKTYTKNTTLNIQTCKPSLDSSVDDDEDFDFEDKKTILIKTYDKVPKPLKAKSTGSITQNDIDEMKARIEAKKKLLLVKAMTEDTKELRDLIKKWQKGCQDALMQLMDLMKTMFPDKQNMDYSEILKTLKIPAPLVGYDSDNDCFNTPDDANIILSKFNDF